QGDAGRPLTGTGVICLVEREDTSPASRAVVFRISQRSPEAHRGRQGCVELRRVVDAGHYLVVIGRVDRGVDDDRGVQHPETEAGGLSVPRWKVEYGNRHAEEPEHGTRVILTDGHRGNADYALGTAPVHDCLAAKGRLEVGHRAP